MHSFLEVMSRGAYLRTQISEKSRSRRMVPRHRRTAHAAEPSRQIIPNACTQTKRTTECLYSDEANYNPMQEFSIHVKTATPMRKRSYPVDLFRLGREPILPTTKLSPSKPTCFRVIETPAANYESQARYELLHETRIPA